MGVKHRAPVGNRKRNQKNFKSGERVLLRGVAAKKKGKTGSSNLKARTQVDEDEKEEVDGWMRRCAAGEFPSPSP
jgi:hypothetical protein